MSSAVTQVAPPLGASLPSTETPLIRERNLMPLSDDALVSRTRAGDLEAFEELLGRHEENLLRLAFRFVRNEHDAQEVLQDVFVTTWRKLPGFQDRAQIGSWLYRVTVNASLMHLRVRKRRPECVDLAPVDRFSKQDFDRDVDLDIAERHRPDSQLESQELRRVIQGAMERLPPSLRSVFELREMHGWSTRQTAKLLGLSEATVKTRLHRARRMLREKVEGYLLQ
jgi:RNA polymerase sigma-70 factor (ECF subfamily)